MGKILPRVIAAQPNAGRMREVQVRLAFETLLGPALAGACESIDFRAGVLWIETANPALAHQLRLDAEVLIAKLNQAGLGRRVREIKLRTGRGPGRPPS